MRRIWSNATFSRLVIAVKFNKGLNVLRYIYWAVSSISWRPRQRSGGPKLKRWKTPLRGKSGLNPREETQPSLFRCNFYFHVLRLPWPLFLLCMMGTYAVTSIIFALVYYVDVEGLHVETKTDWPAWLERCLPPTGKSMLTVFLYSCSISTNFSQSNVDAHSLYTLFFGNFHALVMQLISEFWCSALCERISQPVKMVRWSTVGVISRDRHSSSLAGISCPAEYWVLTLRFDLLGAYTTGLIDAKFDVMCMNTSQFPLLMSKELTLVRKEASSITRGALLQHIIDEASPLFGCDIEELKSQDFILGVSVRAVEKTTMRQVFSEHHYSAHDGEILWDREFEDQMYADEDGNAVYDYTLLDSVRANEGRRSNWEMDSVMNPKLGPAKRGFQRRYWKYLLFLVVVFSCSGRVRFSDQT